MECIKAFLKKVKVKMKQYIKKSLRFVMKKRKKLLNYRFVKRIDKFCKILLRILPKYWHIRRKLAILLGKEKQWKRAASHWEMIVKSKRLNLTPTNYLQYALALKKSKQNHKAMKVLTEALSKYPRNKKIILQLSSLLREDKKYKKATNVLIKLFEMERTSIPLKAYQDLTILYIKQGLYDRARYINAKGLNLFPNDETLINSYAQIAILKKDWDLATKRLENILNVYQDNTPMDCFIWLSMLYQHAGDHSKAAKIFNHVLEKYEQAIQKDKLGYRKMILFDNGESRIEFYKSLKKVNQVVVTFDSINMKWQDPSFGFPFILRQNVDIVAVRKREKGGYQQDLSVEDFVKTAELLVNGYADKVGYGFSLGGYLSLYFASKLNCRILSLAPRISAHPIYGKEHVVKQQIFNHHLSPEYNAEISPIIVYDPKNKRDRTYVHENLLLSFPNARLVKIYYGGHAIARHLLRMGVLKEFVLAVLEGRVPEYDRTLKSKSSNYYRLLGRECFRRNKLKWARDLCERAAQLTPTDRRVIQFKVEVLSRLNKMDEAITYAKEAVTLVPKNIHVRIMLIDLYIAKKELIDAEKEIKKALRKFKDAPELIRRMEQVENLWGQIPHQLEPPAEEMYVSDRSPVHV